MISDLKGDDRQALRDYALGGGALPQHLRNLGTSPEDAITTLKAASEEMMSKSGLDANPNFRIRSAMLYALARDADWAMSGDLAIRRKGLNSRLRSSFENLRGGVDTAIPES